MDDIKTAPVSIDNLVKQINKGKYNFDLSIQRRRVWNKNENSLFIDSIIRNYPIYPALVNKHSDSKILDVVDFKQRFTALADYINDVYALSKNLNPVVIDNTEYVIAGKKFSKLDEPVRERIINRDLSIITMTNATPEEIIDIFDRINMGHPLCNGQKRSTIENDELRDIIYEISTHSFIDKITTTAQKKKNEDREIIIQTLMLIDDQYELSSFTNDDINKFIRYYNENIDQDNIKLINKALDKLDEHFTEKVKIKKTTLPFVIYGAFKILKNSKSMTKYLAWLDDFLATYSDNSEYLEYCNGSGTASPKKVQGRLEYFKKAIKEL